jgi:hypothetical protein
MKITASPKPKQYIRRKVLLVSLSIIRVGADFASPFFEIFHFFVFFPQLPLIFAVFRPIGFSGIFSPFECQKNLEISCSGTKLGLKCPFQA